MGFCIQKVQDKEINYEMWNAQNQKVAFLKSAFVAKLQLWSIPLVGLGYNWGGEWIIHNSKNDECDIIWPNY